jgi:hypothetical protein
MTAITKPCPNCRRTLVGRVETDGSGHTVDVWPPCPCEAGAAVIALQPDELSYEERAAAARKTGVCMDCDQPVEGRRGWALRCADHKRRARLDQENAARRTKEKRAERRKYERKYRRKKSVRERRNARRRELHAERMATDPEYAEAYRRRKQRETSIKHPSYVKRIEYFRRTNADPERAERKRQLAREAYYRAHPQRPKPVCATCEEPIPYDGRGAPPKYHQTDECNPYFTRSDQKVA